MSKDNYSEVLDLFAGEQQLDSDKGSIITSEISVQAKPKKHTYQGDTRYRWNSNWEFAASSMACLFSVHAFDDFVQVEGDDSDPGIVHHLIICIFLSLPLYYMQLLLGQYTQMGTILFKYLSPIGHGVGLSFVTNLLLKSIKYGILTSKFFVFMVTAMQSELQWMVCPANVSYGNTKCFDFTKNCTKNCIGNGTYPSAAYYYYIHTLKNPPKDIRNLKLTFPTINHIVTLTLAWITTALILVYATKHYIKVLKVIWNLTLCLFSSLMVGCVLGRTNGVGLFRLCNINMSALANVPAWAKSISNSISLMGLGRAFNIIHGSYMTTTAHVTWLSLIIVSFNFLLTVLCSLFTETCLGEIQKAAHADAEGMLSVYPMRGGGTFFIIAPQALGFLAVPQLWTVLYYANGILILTNNQISNLITIEKTLSDAYPSLLKYRKYVLGILCIVSYVCGIFLLSKDIYLLYLSILYKMSDEVEVFNCMMMTILVCYIYGVQRFCDDVHYNSGHQPATIWKLCWTTAPILTVICNTYTTYFSRAEALYNTKLMDYVLYAFLISPVIIVACIEVFRFAKERNLIGLFQPEERYGPPDPEERHLRRIFNPRQETRSKRRNDQCQHRCLYSSKILKKIVQEEIKYRREYDADNDNDYENLAVTMSDDYL